MPGARQCVDSWLAVNASCPNCRARCFEGSSEEEEEKTSDTAPLGDNLAWPKTVFSYKTKLCVPLGRLRRFRLDLFRDSFYFYIYYYLCCACACACLILFFPFFFFSLFRWTFFFLTKTIKKRNSKRKLSRGACSEKKWLLLWQATRGRLHLTPVEVTVRGHREFEGALTCTGYLLVLHDYMQYMTVAP